jgi:hypothetical protein
MALCEITGAGPVAGASNTANNSRFALHIVSAGLSLVVCAGLLGASELSPSIASLAADNAAAEREIAFDSGRVTNGAGKPRWMNP